MIGLDEREASGLGWREEFRDFALSIALLPKRSLPRGSDPALKLAVATKGRALDATTRKIAWLREGVPASYQHYVAESHQKDPNWLENLAHPFFGLPQSTLRFLCVVPACIRLSSHAHARILVDALRAPGHFVLRRGQGFCVDGFGRRKARKMEGTAFSLAGIPTDREKLFSRRRRAA